MDPVKDLQSKLHLRLAEDLLRRVESGEASAAELNVARQFLKDNGIECAVGKPSEAMRGLAKAMPFPAHPGGEDDEERTTH